MGQRGDTWSEFERQTPAGLQAIKIYRAREVWQHLFYCTLVPALPLEVAAAVAPARDIRLFVPAHAALQDFPRFDYSPDFDCFVACSADALDRLLAAFLVSMESQCLPALDACQTASGILDFDAKPLHGLHLIDSAVFLGLNHMSGREDMVALLERQARKSNNDRGRLRILNEVATRLSALRLAGPQDSVNGK